MLLTRLYRAFEELIALDTLTKRSMRRCTYHLALHLSRRFSHVAETRASTTSTMYQASGVTYTQ